MVTFSINQNFELILSCRYFLTFLSVYETILFINTISKELKKFIIEYRKPDTFFNSCEKKKTFAVIDDIKKFLKCCNNDELSNLVYFNERLRKTILKFYKSFILKDKYIYIECETFLNIIKHIKETEYFILDIGSLLHNGSTTEQCPSFKIEVNWKTFFIKNVNTLNINDNNKKILHKEVLNCFPYFSTIRINNHEHDDDDDYESYDDDDDDRKYVKEVSPHLLKQIADTQVSLRKLTLPNDESVTSHGFKQISRMKTLETITINSYSDSNIYYANIHELKVSNDDDIINICKLRNLKHLDIHIGEGNFTFNSLVHFNYLENLEHFEIGMGCNKTMTDLMFDIIISNKPNLFSLSIDLIPSSLRDQICNIIVKRLPHLKNLTINHGEYIDLSPLKSLENLTEFDGDYYGDEGEQDLMDQYIEIKEDIRRMCISRGGRCFDFTFICRSV